MAANLVFAYLVVGRRANQLATGLTLMFFGFGLSALIGRPFVGTLIAGLPKLRFLGPGTWAIPLSAYDILVYLAVPDRGADLVAAVPHDLGAGLRAVGESPAAAVAAGLQSCPAAISGARCCRDCSAELPERTFRWR